jgi:hypothetical protein
LINKKLRDIVFATMRTYLEETLLDYPVEQHAWVRGHFEAIIETLVDHL